MNIRVPRSTHLVLLIALVVACIVWATGCITPDDTAAASAAGDRYVERVNESTAKYQRNEIDLAAWKAEVAVARAQLKADLAEIQDAITERTKTAGGVLGGATDPLALGITALLSTVASIFGTNTMRNKSRQAEIKKLEGSIAETDKWVEEVEAKASAAKE